jgi:4-hydroxybenzoate polyprenyltransferase
VAIGPGALALLVGGTAAGFTYNLGLKDTALSWLPYLVAFALLPAYVWVGLDVYRGELLWLYLLAAPLALSVHVANAAPDIETDGAAGRRGLAVRLGRRRAATIVLACSLAPVLLTALSLLWLDYDLAVLLPVLVLCCALAITTWRLSGRTQDRVTALLAFRLTAIAAALFVGGWLAAV